MLPRVSSSCRIFYCRQATDMRKSYDGLENLVRTVLSEDPLTGHLFVFINRRRNRLKVLFWDGDGFCLFCKRLEKGTFCRSFEELGPDPGVLYMMLGGLDISSIKKRKRYEISKA